MLSLLAVSWEESSIPHLATSRFMHADDNNTQYKMVSMVKHFISSIFPTKWLRPDNMAITCQRMGKKTWKEKTTTCRRHSLSARRVNWFCFSKHGAGSTKRSFSSLLFLYGWHFPPVSFEEFLTPGVFLCCQFVAGLVRMRIFPASIIPESSNTRCFYPLKKSKNTIISSEFPTILEQLTQDRENPQEAE